MIELNKITAPFEKKAHNFFKIFSFKIFEIHEKDKKKLIYLSFLNFTMMFANAMGTSIATSLLLKNAGIELLPSMYSFNSLGIILVSFMTFSFITKFNQISILKYAFLIFSFTIILLRMAIGFNVVWAYPLLYFGAALFGWIYYTQFWTLATDICNIREGKRMFSLIVSAGLLGGIAGGFTTNAVVGLIHTNNLLYVWAFSFFAIGIGINYFESSLFLKKTKDPVSEPVLSFFGNFSKTLKNFRDNKLLGTIGITFFIYAMAVYLLDFQFNVVLNNHFQLADKLTAFYGDYFGIFYAATFLIVIFLVSKILKVLGVGNTMLSLPIVVCLGFLLLFFRSDLRMVVSIKFLRDVVGNSLIESSYPLLFLPIVEKLRREAFAFTDSFIMPAGIFLSGLIIVYLPKFFGLNSIIIFAILLSIAWIFFSLKLKEQYFRTFVESIDSKSYFEKEETLNDINHLGKQKTLEVLKRSVYDENEKVSIFSIELLGKLKNKEATNILLEFLKNEKMDPRRRATALLMLGNSGDFTIAFNLMPFLNDKDARVRANVIEAIGKLDSQVAKDVAADFINDENARVKMNSAIILWKSGDKEVGFRVLEEMLKNENPENRIRAMYALSEIESDRIFEFAGTLLGDENDEVRLYMAKVLSDIKEEKATKLLIKMLNDRSRKVRRQVFQAMEERLDKKLSDLLLELMKNEGEFAQKEIIFLIMKSNNAEYVSAILDYCQKETKKIYENFARIISLEKYCKLINKDKKNVLDVLKIIIDSIKIRNERKLFKILRILSGVKKSTVFVGALRRLRDSYDSESRANAIDIIENMVGSKFVSSLVPLLDNTTLQEKNEIGIKLWDMPVFNAKEVLNEMRSLDNFKGMKVCAQYVLEKGSVG